jgi:hypothetical protein
VISPDVTLSSTARVSAPISLSMSSDGMTVAGTVTAGSLLVSSSALVVSGSMTGSSSLDASGTTFASTGTVGCTTPGCVAHLNYTQRVSLGSSGKAVAGVIRMVTSSMHLSGSSSVSASGRGAAAGAGTSPGGTASTNGGGGAGGGHGGDGGAGQSNANPGSTYGDMLWPVTSGSGGGAGYYRYSSSYQKRNGGGGGGVIHLNVSGTLELDSGASITSNGAAGEHGVISNSNSNYGAFSGGGGGSGGSVLIVAQRVLGSGLINASGGCAAASQGVPRRLPRLPMSNRAIGCFGACPTLQH